MPRLETDRLYLRPPEYCDVPAMVALLGDYDVAKNLSAMPHPYGEADAREFVTRMHEQRAKGEGFCFAIFSKDDETFLGCCGLCLKDGSYELGYWVGKPFWNRGYATEAVRKLVGFAFHDLKAESVRADWFFDNPASGRVLEKLGARPDGTESKPCRARGRAVVCNVVTLTRENFRRKKSLAAKTAQMCLETR